MSGKEFQQRSPNRCRVAVLASVVCLASLSAQPLLAAGPAPMVRFDQTVIPPDVPLQVLIGEDVAFKVRFRNDLSPGALVGYGPFVDLVLDAGGANLRKPPQEPPCPCDGMSFVQASLISVSGGPVPLVHHQTQVPCVPSTSNVAVSHPFASSGIAPLLVPAGSQLVTLELPFGSFDPTQPEVVVEVTVHVSNLADSNAEFKIYARAGFRYGATPQNDAPLDWPVVSDRISGSPPPLPPLDQQTDSTLWNAAEGTTATVIIVEKRYLGPEDETASGPGFMRRYQINVDLAAGQTLHNLTVTDRLPGSMAFHALVSPTTPCFVPVHLPPADQANSGSANWLALQCASLTGVPGPDASVAFEFFIPERDADGDPVLSPSCGVASAINDVTVEGDWTPLDLCDIGPVHVMSDVTAADHTLAAKCLAIQKTVAVLPAPAPGHPIPGDALQYTLTFQLSDYKTAGSLNVQDLLSDGQTIVPGSLTLTVTDPCGTTTGTIPPSAWTQTVLSCAAGAPPARTKLDIDVSAAMVSLATPAGPWRHQQGILTGGQATSPASGVPAIGTITFRAVIDDAFQCPVTPPHDLFVDKEDPLSNAVELSAALLTNTGSCQPSTVPSPDGFTAEDESAVELFIASGALEKTVYAVKRGGAEVCGPNAAPCAFKPEVFPGDAVTFRLTKAIPSGDAETLIVRDWLPLPAFLLIPGTFTSSPCGLPAPGNACLGPSNTLTVVPTFTQSGSTNSVAFDYGTFNDPSNQPHTIDLLLTATVAIAPSPDALSVTNEAAECEGDTFGRTYCQAAIAQVLVREPLLRISKGIVAANNPNAVFSPAQTGPVTFNPPATNCRRFNGSITSAGLASFPINSNVGGVDANDCVTFAIVVENRGGSPAWDIKLRDLFPLDSASNLECFDPNFATLCVTDGTGAPIPFTTGSGFLNGSNPITLLSPLPALGSTGSNLAVITFDACVIKNIEARCCDNTAQIESYASVPAGPNFVDAALGGPFEDVAQLCVMPQALKSIVTTSEAHTAGTPAGSVIAPETLAIGEIIRYRIELVIPESVLPVSYRIEDSLPAGLSYLPGTATVTTMSAGLAVTHSPPLVSGGQTCAGGGALLIDFGNVTNAQNTSALEFVVVEFNALVCNVASNQNGAQRDNSFDVQVDGNSLVTSNIVTAIVVEPNITIAKLADVSSMSVGATVAYAITLANDGTATAFDLRLTDSLPACLQNLSNVQIVTSGGVTGATNSSGTLFDLFVAVESIPPGGTVTVTYSTTLRCLDCSRLANTAKIEWTSLPGPMGTVPNATGSSTPGTGGFPDGERESGGGVNDYVAEASAGLCCVQVSSPTTSCNAGGSFTHTFDVTNFTSSPVSGVTVTPISPANTTIAPSTIAVPLASGASTTVTVAIAGTGAISGAQSCFSIELIGQGGVVCRTERCVTLPTCCVEPPRTMVAWYPLDEQAGETAVNDVAPTFSGFTFNNVGTPKPGPVGPIGPGVGPMPVGGMVNGALYFWGPPYVEVPSHAELDFVVGSFSIDAWVRAVACGPGFLSPIVDKYDSSTNDGFAFFLDHPSAGTSVLKLLLNGSTYTSPPFPTGSPNPLQNSGAWSHVAVTYNLLTVNFYVDGSLLGSLPAPAGGVMSSVPMWIGGLRPAGPRCEIAIDELEIFGRALDEFSVELQGIYDAGSGGKCRSDVPATGSLCVTKFEDLNRDGTQDFAEPLLSGWTFTVTDSNNVTIGSITTAPDGSPQNCLTLPAGAYSITEQLRSGWTATTPIVQTVTVSSGQTVTATFGNWTQRRRRLVRR